MSRHAKSAHRSLRLLALVLVYFGAKSAHRWLADITVLPGVLGFRRYGQLVRGHGRGERYRYVTAWTESGLARRVARREAAYARASAGLLCGNLDFRYAVAAPGPTQI